MKMDAGASFQVFQKNEENFLQCGNLIKTFLFLILFLKIDITKAAKNEWPQQHCLKIWSQQIFKENITVSKQLLDHFIQFRNIKHKSITKAGARLPQIYELP